MKQPLFLAIAGWLAVTGSAIAGVPSPQPLSPESIMTAQENLTYSGTLVISSPNGIAAQKANVAHGKDMRRRQEYLGPGGEVTDLVISDGRVRWHYAPRSRAVQVMPMEPEGNLKQRLALLRRNYRFQVMGQTRQADRTVLLTQFLPVYAGNLVHRLWVDLATHLPLVVERREVGGELVDRSEFTHIVYGPPLSSKLFLFSIPEGCHVTSPLTVLAHGNGGTPPPVGLAFHPQAPRVLPDGYGLIGWQYFSSNRQVPTFTWRYHDGLALLSLFAVDDKNRAEPPAGARALRLGTAPAHLVENGHKRMLMWSAHGTAYTLVGHLPEKSLVTLAESTL